MGKIRNVNILAILGMVLVAFMSIGYAYTEKNYTESSTSKKSWDVAIDSNAVTSNGPATDTSIPAIIGTKVNFNINFNASGDYKTYNFKVDNNGDINAILNSIKVIGSYSDVTFSYNVYNGNDLITSSNDNIINASFNSLKAVDGTNTVEVKVMYNGQTSLTANYEMDLNYVQAN